MKKPLLLGATLLPLVLAAACSSKTETRGQLMLSMQTDLSLPKDVDTVRIEVSTFGKVNFAQDYPVGPSGAKIPATLGVLAGSDKSAPVRIRIIAKLGGKDGTARLLREAVTTVPSGRIANLRMPLQYLSLGQVVQTGSGSVGTAHASGVQIQGVGTLDATSSAELVADPVQSSCGPDMTSDNGTCVSVNVDSEALPEYEPAEVFGGGDESGTGGVCFDTVVAMARAIPSTVDLEGCSIARPSGQNVNVALLLPAGKEGICDDSKTKCYVPLDGESDSGWHSDGAKIKLPPAVCSKLKDGSVTSVLASDDYFVEKKPGIPTCGPWSGVTTPASAATVEGGTPIVSGGGEAGVPFDAPIADATVGGRDATSPPDSSTGFVDAGEGFDSSIPFTDSGVIIDPKADAGFGFDASTGSDAGGFFDGGFADAAAPGPGQILLQKGRAYGLLVDSANLMLYAQMYDGEVLSATTGTSNWSPVVGAKTGAAAVTDHYTPRMAVFAYAGLTTLFRSNMTSSPFMDSAQVLPILQVPTPVASSVATYAMAPFGSTMAFYQNGASGLGIYTCSNTSCTIGSTSKIFTPTGSVGRIVFQTGSRIIWTESAGLTFQIRTCDITSCAATVSTLATADSSESPFLAISPSGTLVWSETGPGNIKSCAVDAGCSPQTILAAGQSLAITTPYTGSIAHYIATNGSDVYWTTNNGDIRHAMTAAPGKFDTVSSGWPNPTALALVGSTLYWTNTGNPDVSVAVPGDHPSIVKFALP